MIKSNYSFFALLLFLLFFQVAFSQQKLPLKTILNQIEKQHRVKFNYIDEEVSGYSLMPPNSALILSQKIDYLEENTLLVFDNINTTYITISKKKEEENKIIDQNNPAVALEEVTIDNYLTTGISKKSDETYIIKPKKFGILPGLTEPDVLQTMQQIPGICSVDESISTINVRGGTHDQNLFLWNGIRMFQTGHFFGMISAFNPNLTDKIVISKNGTSPFYGESVSGLVAISSSPDKTQDYNSSISSNMISTEFDTKIKTSEKAVFQLSGRRSMTDFFASPTYKKYYNRVFQNTIVMNLDNNEAVDYKTDEDFYFYDFTAQYQQKIGQKNELSVALITMQNSLHLAESTIFNGGFVSKNSNLQQQDLGSSLNWVTHWNDKNYSTINLYASSYSLDSKNEAVENNQVLKQKNTVMDSGFQLENHFQINPNLSFGNGYQYNETGVRNNDEINNPQFLRKIKEVLRTHALILESDWNSSNRRFGLKTGLRTNYIEEFDTFIFEPRFQFHYSVSKKVQMDVLGEAKSQTASQVIDLQQDFLGIEKRRWTLADNNTIPIQKSRQIELGFTFKNNGWLVTFNNYYKKVTGISSPGQSFQNQLEFIKINGDYKILGSELLVQKNFEHFYNWISYTLNNNKYTFKDFVPPNFDNNFEIAQTVSWAGTYEWKNLKTALGAKWYTGKPQTTPSTNSLDMTNPAKPEIVYNYPNNEKLPDYFQLNFSASYQWKLSAKCRLQTSFSLLNILNKKNTINRYYRVNLQNKSIESVNTYALERTLNLSVKVDF